jgi:hypothetical protein
MTKSSLFGTYVADRRVAQCVVSFCAQLQLP